MLSSAVTAEEYREYMYENEKEGLITFYHQQGWEKNGLKRFLINSLLHLFDPIEALKLIENDSELKLTEDEWEYARRTSFECLRECMIEKYAATKEELEGGEMKEYFESIGFSDFV